MRNDFEEELKDRLTNYTREPDETFWKDIALQFGQPLPDNMKKVSWGTDTFSAASTMVIFFLLVLGYSITPIQMGNQDTEGALKSANKSKANSPSTHSGLSDQQLTSDINASKRSTTSADMRHPIGSNGPGIRTNGTAKMQDDAGTDRKDLVSGMAAETSSITSQLHDSLSRIETTDPLSPEVPILAGFRKETSKKEIKDAAAKEKEVVRKTSEHSHQKFKLYFTAMPTFGYQRIESNQNDNIIVESINKISAFSTDRLGIRVELGAAIPIATRWEVFGGVLYYQRKQTIGYTEVSVDSTYVSSGPGGDVIVSPTFTQLDKSFEYELKNLGIQGGFNFVLSKGAFLQLLGTGLELQFALNKKSLENEQTFTNNPSAYVFYNLYYRLQYPSEGRLKGVFQPTLNYSFYINQNLNAPFYVKPYGLGLNIGLTYNF